MRTMRNLKITLAGLAMIASVALVATAPAGASRSTDETIVLKRNADLQEIGWDAYGPAFFGSGSWATDFVAFSPDSAPVFAGTIKAIETGSAGSFELDFQVLASAKREFGGNCQLRFGTGAYAGYRGTGTWSFSTDGTRYYTCKLSVHQDP